jgi:dTDP-4-amino-4,6-dideoxygalactose transaminase
MGPKIAAAMPRFPQEDRDEIHAAIEGILQSGRLILGPHTQRFEEAFRDYVGAGHAVAVSTCTAALQIAFRFHRIQGREVILPTNNFVGVVSAILAEGGIPVLADMDPETFCVDCDDALARITPRTAGIAVVHLAGRIDPGIDRLRAVCDERGLFLIEDAAHAHGAAIAGRKAGNLAETACFSFYPTKIITTGTGGMITTSNAKLAQYARSLRHHGVGSSLDDVVNLGNDWCLGEINAVLGLHQLKRVDENVAHRNRMVDLYRQRLGREDWLQIPSHPASVRHAYYKFPVLLGADMDRERFRRMLWTDFAIENGAIYDPPCHLQPVLRQLFGYTEGMFPKAEATLKRQLCPPIHSVLSEAQVHAVADAMIAVAAQCRRP